MFFCYNQSISNKAGRHLMSENNLSDVANQDEMVTESAKNAIEFLRFLVDSKPGGEHRPEQEVMTSNVAEAIANNEHLLVQSGTGTGKTLGYATAVAMSGKKAIISTANNQLSEQIVDKDLPVLSDAYRKQEGKPLSFSLLKGRHHYLCLKKLADLKSMDDNAPGDLSTFVEDESEKASMFSFAKDDKAAETTNEWAELYEWADRTPTGDRSHGPVVSDKTWSSVSMTNAECPGKKNCPFGQQCFAEKARDKARVVDIVVTNHAVVGVDFNSEGTLLGERQVLVADELHELDSYLSSAWGAEVYAKTFVDVTQQLKKANSLIGLDADLEGLINQIEKESETILNALIDNDPARYEEGLPEPLQTSLVTVARTLNQCVSILGPSGKDASESKLVNILIAVNQALSLAENLLMILDQSGETVQWSERPFSRKKTDRPPLVLKAAPLRIGPKLMNSLEENDMTFIGTSATITVAGKFEIPARNLALGEELPELPEPRKFHALDTGTPFDYARQAIMYVPQEKDFPAPIGQERFEHTEAVLNFSVEALKASRGRGLILSTTTEGAKRIGEHLRQHLDTPVLIQGDAPAPQLVQRFKEEVDSTLVATMGMWHGLDAPGPTLSLVIIDKIPFKPMDDPLMKARQEDVESRGGNGFMEVYAASANVMLAQGVGRLIRHSTDKGIVAILDTRLVTKGYGRAMLKSLPPMFYTNSKEQVMNSLNNI